jgi:polyphenol oxidase
MKLTEKEHYYLIEDLFPDQIIAGFTKPGLEGREVEKDIRKALDDVGAKVAFMNQLHSGVVHVINSDGVYDGDALFTGQKGLALVVKTADCLPLFFYDKKTGSIGILHMGWRSAKEGILDNISLDLSSTKALAGVAMRQCCFEVTDEFKSYRSLASFVNMREDKLYFDPVGFSRSALAARGMKKTDFSDINICTICNNLNFFSFRRDKTKNRMLSFIIKK